MASMYLRGHVWWGKWSSRGRTVRQSLKTQDKREARRRLRELEAQMTRGERQTTSKETWDTAAQDLLSYYQAYGTRNPREAEGRLRQLTRYFGGWKLADIDSAAILGYVTHRRAQGRAAATINVDLGTLRKALRLAHEHGMLDKVPVVRMLRPAAPRQGFFERHQFEMVCKALPDDLALVARIGYVYGWRVSSEVLTLAKASRIDLREGTLRLAPGSTKNRDGRLIYLTPELEAGITGKLARVEALEREIGEAIPWLFPHLAGRHQGERIKSFRKRWTRACRQAGCAGALRHDLRRTAVRNMVHLGIPEGVVMRLVGHRTRSMLDRYNIVSPADLREASMRLSGHTISCTI